MITPGSFQLRLPIRALPCSRRDVLRSFLLLVASLAYVPRALSAPADLFVDRIQKDASIPSEARDLIRKAWTECNGCDADEFLTQGLAVLSPRFREGLDAFDAEDYAASAAVMAGLKNDADSFVAAHATVYEIKALAQDERLTEALERLEALGDDGAKRIAEQTYLAADVAFLRGLCLLSDVRYPEAAAALEVFLRDYPDASQRLVIPAQQMLLELSNREPDGISDVADLMNFCGKRLRLTDAGDVVRQRQEKIVELLSRLAEDAEKREKQNSQSGGSSGGSQGNNSRSPSNPLQQSILPGGTSTPGGAQREQRRANPGEAWGAMPPAERERVLQAMRESFPSRYRRLVEQYYEELAKKP